MAGWMEHFQSDKITLTLKYPNVTHVISFPFFVSFPRPQACVSPHAPPSIHSPAYVSALTQKGAQCRQEAQKETEEKKDLPTALWSHANHPWGRWGRGTVWDGHAADGSHVHESTLRRVTGKIGQRAKSRPVLVIQKARDQNELSYVTYSLTW